MVNVWHSAVIDLGCVSSIILWIELKISRVNVYVVVVYGPTKGGIQELLGQGFG